MRRKIHALCLAAVCAGMSFFPAAAMAQPKDILSAVPNEAWAVLAIRNLEQLDAKFQTLGQQLNAPMQLSLLAMIKQNLQLGGINDQGSIAMVAMPLQNPMEAPQKMAVLIPASDYPALITPIGPQDVGDGVSQGMYFNQPVFVGQYGDYAVVGPTAEIVKAVLAAKDGPGIKSKWSAHQIERFAEDDVTLWLNFDAIVSSPLAQPMLGMAPPNDPSVKALREMESAAVSLFIDQKGLRLGTQLTYKPGSDSAKSVAATEATNKTLLTGLPKENFVLALGMITSQAGAAQSAEGMAMAFNNPVLIAQLGADPAKMKEFADTLTSTMKDLRGLAVSVVGLPSGPDGLMGMTKVVTVESNAAAKCEQVSKLIEILASGLIAAPEAQQAMNMIRYSPNAETVDGMSVHHLVVQLHQSPEVDKEWIRKIQKIVGQEGLLVRLGAVDDKHIVATLGGGQARLKKAAELVKSNSAPLSAAEGVKRVAEMLPNQRVGEMYLDFGQLFRSAQEVGRAIDEPDQSPPGLQNIQTPIGATMRPVEQRGLQMDLALPVDVIRVVKDAILSSMAQPAPPPEQPAS